MSGRMWYTKEEMLKDLAVASGGRVSDINDDFIAVGESAPPPPVFLVDDNDLELMFGETACSASINNNEGLPSDLSGITKMIRMVQHYEKEDPKPTNEIDAIKSELNNVIVISKMNPNIKEFVPRGASRIHRDSNIDVDNNIDEKDVNTNLNTTDVNDLPKVLTKSDSEDKQCKTCSQRNKANDESNVEEIAAMLKKQITEAANENSFEKTKEKTHALSKLVKLYSKPAPTASKPKLLSPDFFQRCKASDYDKEKNDDNIPAFNDIDRHKKETNNVRPYLNGNHCNEDVDKDISKVTKVDNNFEYSNGITLLTPEMLKSNIDYCGDSLDVGRPPEKEMKESISKVENWLEKKPVVVVKEKAKPVAYLGAIAFKRKDPVTCKSPSEIVDKKMSKTEENVYKPSKQREEYLKKFNERRKHKEVVEIQSPIRQQSNSLSDIIYHKLLEAEKIKRANKADAENNDQSLLGRGG